MRLGFPIFTVSSQNAAVSKTQLLRHECSAIGTARPLRKFELQQQPSYLLIATPGFDKRAERVLQPLGGWSSTQEVGRPPFSVDHQNNTTVIYGLRRKIGVITSSLVPKTVLLTTLCSHHDSHFQTAGVSFQSCQVSFQLAGV
eukprot:363722-Chlamydomonas_euryale.AAC.3